MGTYDRQIAQAKRAIAAKGQWVLWNRISNGVADLATPWLPVDSASLGFVVKIVFLPEQSQLLDFVRAVQGTEVKSGHMQGLMGAVAFKPDPQDTVNRDGVILQIDSIDELAPNGQTILYTVKFKG